MKKYFPITIGGWCVIPYDSMNVVIRIIRMQRFGCLDRNIVLPKVQILDLAKLMLYVMHANCQPTYNIHVLSRQKREMKANVCLLVHPETTKRLTLC